MEVVQTVVAMSSIFLLRATSSLISLCPCRLNTLPASAPNARRVVERMPIHTVVLMVMDVHLGNATSDALDNGDEVRKPFFESRNPINAMLAFYIVAPADIRLVLVLFQDASYRIITVTVSVLQDQSNVIKDLGIKCYLPFALLKVYHPTRFKKLMTSTLNSKYATDVLIFELGDVLHNRGLQTVAGRLLRAPIMSTNQI
jgi:hypothetical protein